MRVLRAGRCARHALGVALLASLVLAGVAGAADVVDWHDAAQCLDRVCGVRGTVAAMEPDGPTYRLYFDERDRTVRIVLMRGWLVTWPHYVGQTIVATGRVTRFGDHLEMLVRDPDDVVVVGGAAPPTADSPAPVAPTAPPATPTAAPPTRTAAEPTPAAGEVEELRRRIRELEQRVEELEGR